MACSCQRNAGEDDQADFRSSQCNHLHVGGHFCQSPGRVHGGSATSHDLWVCSVAFPKRAQRSAEVGPEETVCSAKQMPRDVFRCVQALSPYRPSTPRRVSIPSVYPRISCGSFKQKSRYRTLTKSEMTGEGSQSNHTHTKTCQLTARDSKETSSCKLIKIGLPARFLVARRRAVQLLIGNNQHRVQRSGRKR